MSFGTYIFAFNNTLFDTRKGYEASYKKAFNAFDITYESSKYYQYFETPLYRIFESNFPGCPCKYREFVAEFFKETDIRVVDTAVPYFDTIDSIKRLLDLGKDIAIVSGSPETYIKNILKNNNMNDLFKSIVGFEQSMIQKPDPYSINVCIRELGADPKDCVYIGGNLNDMVAAECAGVEKIFVDRTDNGKNIEIGRVIPDLTGLPL